MATQPTTPSETGGTARGIGDLKDRPEEHLDPTAVDFYCRAMSLLSAAEIPFLVGGAYAFARYTGIVRHTKDFDIFLRPRDFERALAAFEGAGFAAERNFPHWLGKAWSGDWFVDLIFSSGNGVARVDLRWFEHAVPEQVLGTDVLLCPVEEMIWSKAFIMERERFDGGDVIHLLRGAAERLDWDRLLERFGDDWRVLYAHLVLFGYVYPGCRQLIPERVLADLAGRVAGERSTPAGEEKLCRGTILSRAQYLPDLEMWGFRDARLRPEGSLSRDELDIWTEAAREEEEKQLKLHLPQGEE